MDKNKNIIIVVVVILIIVGLVWYSKNKGPLGTKEPIKIGHIGPLSGDAVAYGEPVKNAAQLAIDEINVSGGIGGRKIEFIAEDGKCTGKEAVNAAQKLINIDKVKIILGAGCSGETLAIAPIAEQNKILLFSSLASSPEISKAGDYIFRNTPSDLEPGIQLAELVYKKYKNAAVISENTDYAQGLKKVFIEKFTSLGGSITLEEDFKQGEKDFLAYGVKIKLKKPDVIFINSQTGSSEGNFVKQIRQAGIQLSLYGLYLGTDPDFQKIAGKAMEDFIYLDFVADPANSKVAEFLSKYKEKFGKEASYPQFATLSYDAPYILKEAIEKVGDDPTKIKDYLYTLKGYAGVIGQYSLDQNGDVVGIPFKVFQLKDGKPMLISQ